MMCCLFPHQIRHVCINLQLVDVLSTSWIRVEGLSFMCVGVIVGTKIWKMIVTLLPDVPCHSFTKLKIQYFGFSSFIDVGVGLNTICNVYSFKYEHGYLLISLTSVVTIQLCGNTKWFTKNIHFGTSENHHFQLRLAFLTLHLFLNGFSYIYKSNMAKIILSKYKNLRRLDL